MFKKIHRNVKAHVTFSGHLSGEIAIANGVKQGDIPASTLLPIFFFVLLTHAFKDCDQGIPLRFRTSGKVFNLSKIQHKIRDIYRTD